MPQRCIDSIPAQVHHCRSRLDPYFDVWMTLIEAAQARYLAGEAYAIADDIAPLGWTHIALPVPATEA